MLNPRLRAGVTLMRVLLGTAVAAVVVGAVRTVLGYSGLDLGGHMIHLPNLPLLGDPAPSIPVTPDGGFRARLTEVGAKDFGPTAFPWKDTSDGTRDAYTGLPPVELAGWHSLSLYFWGPTFRDRLAYAGPVLFAEALALTVLVLLWRIVRTLALGEVFVRDNARRMVAIGLVVAAGGSLAQLLRALGWADMVAHSAAAGVVRVAWSFSFLPLLAGAVILLLAEVFRQGVGMRADVDGLV